MESKWRYNVADLGLVGRGIAWLARLHEPVDGYWYVAKRADTDEAYQLGTPVIFDELLLWQATIRPAMGKTFPYGYEVEPD